MRGEVGERGGNASLKQQRVSSRNIQHVYLLLRYFLETY